MKAKILNTGAVLLVALALHAQQYSIDWHTIDGGGTSTDGVFSVSGTIGQPDAGPAMSGGNFSLAGGFWSLFVVQTPGTPSLNIARSNAFVIVSWPVTGLNFQLQENTDLSLPNSWFPVAQAAVTNAGQVSVTVPTTIGRKFFRLKSQ